MRISRRRRWSLYAVTALLWASGAAIWLLARAADGGSGLAERFELWPARLRAAHGGGAILFLLLFGTLLSTHVRRGWRLRTNRPSGGTVVALAALLVGTGWLLYYSGSERVRDAALTVHDALGLVLPVGLAVHIVLGRRRRARATEAALHLAGRHSPPK